MSLPKPELQRERAPKPLASRQKLVSSLKKGHLPLKELNPEINEFRSMIFDVYSEGKDRKKIKAILRETVRKLKSVK